MSLVNDGNWHHAALVYDPTAVQDIQVYIDRVLETSKNFNTVLNTTAGSNIMIGQLDLFSNQPLDGVIDDIRVWDRAESATEILDDMFISLIESEPNLSFYLGMDMATNTAY